MPRVYRLDKFEQPDMEALIPQARRVVMRGALKYVQDWLRTHVPDSGVKHKGKLNKSIRVSVYQGGLVGKVKATAPHAHLVHDGTDIRPVTLNTRRSEPAKALAIPGYGYYHSATAGRMPANPFMTDAEDKLRPAIEELMRVGTEAAIEAYAEGREP